MPIPTVIHYVWVGPHPLSPNARRCIESWRTYLPDYAFMRWNEKNSPMDRPYVREMYTRGKWAFVSDYIRFWALYEHGGIYLDTDMEVRKPLDRFLADRIFFGRTSSDGFISCGIIGAMPGHPFVKKVLEEYDHRTDGTALITSPRTVTQVYEHYPDKAGVRVYGPEYFYPCNAGERCTEAMLADAYTNHHWEESWVVFRALRKFLRRIGVRRFLRFFSRRLFRLICTHGHCFERPGLIRVFDGISRVAFDRPRYQWRRNFWDADLYLAPYHHIDRRIIAFGMYDRNLHCFLERLLRPGMVCLDVGANLGEVALHMAAKVGRSGKVYAFEPSPMEYQRLALHVERNAMGDVIEMSPMALSNTTGTVRFGFGDEAADNRGLGSFVNVERTSISLFQDVPTTTIDEFVRQNEVGRIDLVKMDVQGAELFILEGGGITFSGHAPDILTEISPEDLRQAGKNGVDLLRFVEQLGYSAYEICRGRLGKRLRSSTVGPTFSTSNVFCTKKSVEGLTRL